MQVLAYLAVLRRPLAHAANSALGREHQSCITTAMRPFERQALNSCEHREAKEFGGAKRCDVI